MDLSSTLGSLLIFLGLYGICTGFVQENCIDYKLQFERVFSVPGDMAMLNSTLLSPEVLNFTTVPYNITWYVSKTGEELSNQTGRILIRGETLWFLNVTLDDEGEYVSIVRTPSECYQQATKLVVDPSVTGQCERPRKAHQKITRGVNDNLNCPLKDYVNKLKSYNITYSIVWYRGCDPIQRRQGNKYIYWDMTKLMIKMVEAQDNGSYTCTLHFTLGGIMGSVSETINAWVTEVYSLAPQVQEPANEIVKAQTGSNFSKRCLVFVPGIGEPFVDIMWLARNEIIFNKPLERFYTSNQRMWSQDVPIKGVWLERTLIFSEVWEKDFDINYTCRAYSSRGNPEAYFTLLPVDPNLILPIGSMLGGVMVLFVINVALYYIYKVDIVLWFRRMFPVLYTDKDSDGKLYDAYVAYPQPCAVGFSEEVETFALHTLPQVLENACGYKLFIVGRDCLPGQAIVDSVEENIQASRRLLLLYNASTFTSKSHTNSTSSNNNNICKSSYISDNRESKTSDISSSTDFYDSEEVYPETRQQLECVAGMHRALLEGTLKVILVELEEITPAQLALFPESVRHLRKKQGAVCWWKNLRTRQRWRTCINRRDEKEQSGLGRSLSPFSRFWKEMRYHMPVKGKRVIYPEKTVLLNL